ncbi:MAG: YecA family protein [Rickettsiaceae bacterium]
MLTQLHAILPDIAEKETRSITFQGIDPNFPSIRLGSYHFTEMFCTDISCDCRIAMIRVVDDNGELLATLRYAWESEDFYTDWMGGDAEFGKETPGAKLYPLQPQGEEYLEFEKVFKTMIEQDPKYAERIKRHYKLFRIKLHNSSEAKKKIQNIISPKKDLKKIGRNEPCSCGSGKKYKKCCMLH